MIRILASLSLIAFVVPAFAADIEPGVWRGTIEAENPRAKEGKVETKAALHLSPDGNQLYLENINKALPVVEIAPNKDGTVDIITAGPPNIELRNVRFGRNGFDAVVLYENEISAPLTGRASFDRMKPMSPPSFRGDCKSAPDSLAALCGVWSGISLRGQPKLLVIDTITRNKQKVSWELKAKQSWGGENDLASAGMSFPYTEYVTDEQLPLGVLPMRTTGKLSYRFDVSGDQLIGGHITDPADRTTYTRIKN